MWNVVWWQHKTKACYKLTSTRWEEHTSSRGLTLGVFVIQFWVARPISSAASWAKMSSSCLRWCSVFALALFSQHNVVISTGQYFNHAERNGMFATKSIRFRYPGINWPIILTIEFLARRQYRKPPGVGIKVFLERALTKCTSDTRVGNQAMFHPLSRCTSRNYELESEYSFPGYQGQQHNLIRWTSLLVKN